MASSTAARRFTAPRFLPLAVAIALSVGPAWMLASCNASPQGLLDAGDASLEASSQVALAACAACTSKTCVVPWSACAAEPSCAEHLECLARCEVDRGDVDEGCEATCRSPIGTAAEAALAALLRCRSRAAHEGCAACPRLAVEAGTLDPLFRQACAPNTDPDAAGPDATPVELSCAQCRRSRCCESQDVYRGTDGAVATRDCENACYDDPLAPADCLERCYADASGEAVAAWITDRACALTRCFAECGGTPTPCTDCVYGSCANTSAQCAREPDCTRAQACVTACPLPDRECFETCWDRYPKGAEAQREVFSCLTGFCGPICQ